MGGPTLVQIPVEVIGEFSITPVTAEHFYSTWVRSFLCSDEEMHKVTDHHYTASTNVMEVVTFVWKSQHLVPMQQDENVQTVNL